MLINDTAVDEQERTTYQLPWAGSIQAMDMWQVEDQSCHFGRFLNLSGNFLYESVKPKAQATKIDIKRCRYS
jgi:hypothetical protein